MSDFRPTASLDSARSRARMLEQAREFFGDRNILEVNTPLLSRSAVSDPYIESIEARSIIDADAKLFLRTSPEFAMKRLLSAGYPDIYEIGTVFRDGEAGSRHQPEFTMVEWYRLNFSLQQMIGETIEFLGALLPAGRLSIEARRVTYRQAFRESVDIDPFAADLDTLARLAGADDRLRSAIGDTRDDWLSLVLTERVVSGFSKKGLTILYHYPASQASLSRLCPADPAVADRFEIFLGDLELANGYVELTDVAEQRHRFEVDQRRRSATGKSRRPLDTDFLDALESGLPQCAGVAVGFDRLLMVEQDTDDIRDVVAFAFRRKR